MKEKTPIEFSPELAPVLRSLAQEVNANLAILYEYVDVDDVEITELLEEISKSEVITNHKKAIEGNLDHIKIFEDRFFNKIKAALDSYEKGKLDVSTNQAVFFEIKKNVRMLRLSEYADMDPENHKYGYDYTKRPPKYLVFNNDILTNNFKEGTQIKNEGVTSYLMRAKEKAKEKDKKISCSFFSHDEIKSMDAHSRNIQDNNNRYITYGHHAAWVLLSNGDSVPDKDRCLRFEYDKEVEVDKQTDINEALKEIFSKSYIKILNKTIDIVFEQNKSEGYQGKFNCLDPILKQLVLIELDLKRKKKKELDLKRKKKAIPDDDKNKKSDLERKIEIHNLVKHLFCVFKRNTYHGEELIYDRVGKFISSLLNELDFPSKEFTKIWDDLKKQEELMLYDLQNYRDHYIHQFHVFITGYIFIYKYKIEDLRIIINRLYIKEYKDESKINFTELDVLRIWVFTSLYHDCGYSFEKLSKGFETFSENMLHSKLESDFKWEQLFIQNQDIILALQRVSEKFNSCEKNHGSFNSKNIFRIMLQKGILNNDHGVMSAIILLQQFKNVSENIDSNNDKWFNKIPLVKKIIEISALSIALHNKMYSEVSKQGNQRICLNKNPFAFILAFCDNIQEWGRKNSDNMKKVFASPYLEEMNYKEISASAPCNIFEITLKYPIGKNAPSSEFIFEKMNDVCKTFFSSGNTDVLIKYIIEDKEYEALFVNCAKNCQN